MKPLTNSIEDLLGLLRGKYKRYDSVFLETWDIPKGIFFRVTPPYHKLKEGACNGENCVNRAGLHFERGSHVKEKVGMKRIPAGIFIYQVSIENEEVDSVGSHGISQVLTVRDVLLELGCQKAFKGFH